MNVKNKTTGIDVLYIQTERVVVHVSVVQLAASEAALGRPDGGERTEVKGHLRLSLWVSCYRCGLGDTLRSLPAQSCEYPLHFTPPLISEVQLNCYHLLQIIRECRGQLTPKAFHILHILSGA